jgi:hypothetical protein
MDSNSLCGKFSLILNGSTLLVDGLMKTVALNPLHCGKKILNGFYTLW